MISELDLEVLLAAGLAKDLFEVVAMNLTFQQLGVITNLGVRQKP